MYTAQKVADLDKCKAAVIYVAQELTDLYQIVKALYYADKHHLSHYGSTICGDQPVAMKHGPVPSLAYDLMKYALKRENAKDFNDPDFLNSWLVLGDYKIKVQNEPNLSFFSKYDLQSLNYGINSVSGLSFSQLKIKADQEKSYVKHWEDAQRGNPDVKQVNYPLEDMILLDIENGEKILEFLERSSL